jgi:hypothetical protein
MNPMKILKDIDGNNYNVVLAEEQIVSPGDLCLQYETGELFTCAENKLDQDIIIDTNGKTQYHGQDPWLVYKVISKL